MATIEADIGRVIARFEARISLQEKEDFRSTTAEDVQSAIIDIQKKRVERKMKANLSSLLPFIRTTTEFAAALEVFYKTSSLSCYIWGPMKFLLLATLNLHDACDAILDAYEQLGEAMPVLSQFTSLLSTNRHTQRILIHIYEDILEFHLHTLQIFSRPTWKLIFRVAWNDYHSRFERTLNELRRSRELLLEISASFTQIEDSNQIQLQLESSFASHERERKHREKFIILSWLSAPDVNYEQEELTTIREKFPFIGRWILEEPGIRDWLGSNPALPLFWLNGKPGSGKTFLASIIIEQALKLSESEPARSVAFFFCPSDGLRNTFSQIAKALLAQLLRQNPVLLPYLYDEYLKSDVVTSMSPKKCSHLLRKALRAVSKTVIIVDGIDACEEREREMLLRFFTSTIDQSNIETSNLRCMFISRGLVDVIEQLPMARVLELNERHVRVDIREYAIYRSRSIQKRFSLSEAEREDIVNPVCKSADLSFLQARNDLDRLYRQETKNDLFDELYLDTAFLKNARAGLDTAAIDLTTPTLMPSILSEKSDQAPCPTVASRDSGYASMASQRGIQKKAQQNPSGNVEEWDLRSVASVESHVTDITMSSVNPAALGGAAEQLADFLLLNNDIRSLLEEGFQTIESDRFERNFRRLLKDYASSLRKEAKDTLEKGATKIVHTYRAYVTRIIRSKVFVSDTEPQALALHELESQETSKVTLERFLEQYQAPKDDRWLEEPREDLGSEAGSNSSNDEQPYLPNLEKVTEFLVSSAAFGAFKKALSAFVRPALGPKNSATHLEGAMGTDAAYAEQMEVDVLAALTTDQHPSQVPNKRILELDDTIEVPSKRLKSDQMVDEGPAVDGTLSEKRKHSSEQGFSQTQEDVEMLDGEGECWQPSYPTAQLLRQEVAEQSGDQSRHDAGAGYNSASPAHFSRLSNPIVPSQQPPNYVLEDEAASASDAPQMPKYDRDFENSQQLHESSSRLLRQEPPKDQERHADINSGPTKPHTIPDRIPPSELLDQLHVQELNHSLRSRIKNSIKKLLRPAVAPGFQRIEWICDCGDALYADFNKRYPETIAAISSHLKNRPGHSFPPNGNSNSNHSSIGQPSMPAPAYMGHATPSTSTQQSVNTGFSNISQTSTLLGSVSSSSSSNPAFSTPIFFELCVNAGAFLKSLAEIDMKNVRTDGEFFRAVKEHYFRLRSYRARFWLLKPSSVSYVRFSVEERSRVGLLQKPGSVALPPKSEVDAKRYTYDPCPLDDELPISSDLFLHYLLACRAPPSRAAVWLPRIPRKLATSIFHPGGGPAGFGWGVHIDEAPDLLRIFLLNLAGLVLSGGAALAWWLLERDFQGAFGFACWVIAVLNTVMAVFVVKWRRD